MALAAISVDLGIAKDLLASAWSKVPESGPLPSAAVINHLEKILLSENVTFKYILVTGLLGKCVQPKIHPRALQTGSKLKHSYDARSLCHKVVVTFEKDKGDLWGLSNEPFVNKPARHREHDKRNKQLRDKELAAELHDVLELAHQAPPDEVFAMLVHALRLGKKRSENQILAVIEVEATYRRIVEFVRRFLDESDGGTRLVAVVGAFVVLLNEPYDVRIYPPNASDRYSKTSGDIEILDSGKTVSAFECKHRVLNIDDVKHGIRKPKSAGVSEYSFVCAGGVTDGLADEIRKETLAENSGIDMQVLDIFAVTPAWATALNPIRRAAFGTIVTRILREDMHRAEVANLAAQLWNELKK